MSTYKHLVPKPIDPQSIKHYEADILGAWHAFRFLQIVTIYDKHADTDPRTMIIPEYEGESEVFFWATEKERKIIEYIFRRYINLEPIYLQNLDNYQRNFHKMMEERYAIY